MTKTYTSHGYKYGCKYKIDGKKYTPHQWFYKKTIPRIKEAFKASSFSKKEVVEFHNIECDNYTGRVIFNIVSSAFCEEGSTFWKEWLHRHLPSWEHNKLLFCAFTPCEYHQNYWPNKIDFRKKGSA